MRRRLHRTIVTSIICALSLSGCAQMTRHSNTLVFGTNTSFGLTAGTSAANVPSVSVGYQRQEAVVMPLVANVKDVGGVLQPCDISPAIAVGDGGADTPPCMLVGRRDKSLDTYSVLGSFGATFGASGAKGEAQGGLAQYFATGLAAQLLARPRRRGEGDLGNELGVAPPQRGGCVLAHDGGNGGPPRTGADHRHGCRGPHGR